MPKDTNNILISFLLLWSMAGLTGAEKNAGGNPFTAKASLARYWKSHITNDLPKPSFFFNKASPLNAVDFAVFSKLLVEQNTTWSTLFQTLCIKANLLCSFPDVVSPSLQKHAGDVNFTSYTGRSFANYGTDQLGGADSFKNYTNDQAPSNSFRRYSRDSLKHDDLFKNYAQDANLGDSIFNTYGGSATGGVGTFTNYQDGVNDPQLTFSTYSADADGRIQGFTAYSHEANSGKQDFKNYARNGNGGENDFTSYSNVSNAVVSSFIGYGNSGNGIKDSFIRYGFDNNVPQNSFSSYGDAGNGATEIFKSYSDQADVGTDSFTSYARDSNGVKANFESYGFSTKHGPARFTSYSERSENQKVGFTTYGENYGFKRYAKTGVTFDNYLNKSSLENNNIANTKWVEPGKFFRESMLKTGNLMPMPDIKDKMPKRSFLPKIIAAKLPFSSLKIDAMKKMFHVSDDDDDDSRLVHMITDALNECERAPSPGETKRCIGSGEEMIDFATSTLGPNIMVRTTENTNGSNGDILIGPVTGINGGNVTKSVSCHQSFFPYLLYYCHSVPKVRVYEADILDPTSKVKINHGVAICHVDTSSWSPGHGAFLALGSGPGKIEVCHWIFENDMTWTIAD
ncbi:OLC1v1028268C1 [Oldenlandia corymbosa var. corymbosa]|uniref:OLC1v1028268C1 n=1 Tax=Oldenlandia corymbosa var. corymbosa TaxID=529605 RepID=A0AAV1CDD0_OLDCO|nr:OLC1v1028268C1 [Oldenlandia corymbosa var. corymbosa]